MYTWAELERYSSVRVMTLVWALVAIASAVAFGFIAGVFDPREKVNGLWLVVTAGYFYIPAVRFYGRFLARRVVELSDQRITPAYRLHDGTNFYPANKYVFFGHHFAAIAGAGPLLGPVPAAQFGYLPSRVRREDFQRMRYQEEAAQSA